LSISGPGADTDVFVRENACARSYRDKTPGLDFVDSEFGAKRQRPWKGARAVNELLRWATWESRAPEALRHELRASKAHVGRECACLARSFPRRSEDAAGLGDKIRRGAAQGFAIPHRSKRGSPSGGIPVPKESGFVLRPPPAGRFAAEGACSLSAVVFVIVGRAAKGQFQRRGGGRCVSHVA